MGMTFQKEKNRNNKILIKDLKRGDTFLYDNEIFITVEGSQTGYDEGQLGFINLISAKVAFIMPDKEVTLVNIKSTYEIL